MHTVTSGMHSLYQNVAVKKSLQSVQICQNFYENKWYLLWTSVYECMYCFINTGCVETDLCDDLHFVQQ